MDTGTKLAVQCGTFCALLFAGSISFQGESSKFAEAPTGFSTPTLSQLPASESISNGIPEPPGDTFARDQTHFEEQEGDDGGLGPIYNGTSCLMCHQTPVTGGSSQVTELRVGHRDLSGNFVDPTIWINDGRTPIAGRSLVNDRATCAQAQEHVPTRETIRAFRITPSLLGDGFVEAVDDSALIELSHKEAELSNGEVVGEYILVPVLESPGSTRVGRFGWKDQHASLLSFSADAYLNEVGITNRLTPVDLTSVCKATTDLEDAPDEIGMTDVDHFTQFTRGTKIPPRDMAAVTSLDTKAGEDTFRTIGCALCHTPTLVTVPPGTVLNGGTYVVSDAIGNKQFHPFSDFLLHDVGTGDGIVQNGPQDTANKIRTPPLWGLRTRNRYMHDGSALTLTEAIARHRGESAGITRRYYALPNVQKMQLIAFLNSL